MTNNDELDLRHTNIIWDELVRFGEEMKEHGYTEAEQIPAGVEYIKRDFDQWITIADHFPLRLRLDYEVRDAAAKGFPREIPWGDLCDQLVGDFTNLTERGDVDGNDALLKVADGRLKHGKELALLRIGEVRAFAENMPRKDAVEWTVYIACKFYWKESA
jgi:hypothetical protein